MDRQDIFDIYKEEIIAALKGLDARALVSYLEAKDEWGNFTGGLNCVITAKLYGVKPPAVNEVMIFETGNPSLIESGKGDGLWRLNEELLPSEERKNLKAFQEAFERGVKNAERLVKQAIEKANAMEVMKEAESGHKPEPTPLIYLYEFIFLVAVIVLIAVVLPRDIWLPAVLIAIFAFATLAIIQLFHSGRLSERSFDKLMLEILRKLRIT